MRTREEILKEFDDMTENIKLDDESNGSLYDGENSITNWLVKNNDKHLYENSVYGEPMLDLSIEKVREFVKEAFTAGLQAGMKQGKFDAMADKEFIGGELETLIKELDSDLLELENTFDGWRAYPQKGETVWAKTPLEAVKNLKYALTHNCFGFL